MSDRPRLVTPTLLREWPLPQADASKYGRGQVLVVGGARRTPGAAMLAGLSALRMGAGRLTLAVSQSVAAPLAVAVPESGVVGLPDDSRGSVTGEDAGELLGEDLTTADALLVGPGLDDPDGTRRLLEELVPRLPDKIPVVLDAFGATMLPSLGPDLQERLAGRLVLTPNVTELGYLLESDAPAEERLVDATIECAHRFKAVVGVSRTIAWRDDLWEQTNGDAGLGTSGSGDVMAGAVTGLLARGAEPAQAMVWGKHVHAAAGDSLAAHYGRVGYLASELLTELPQMMRTLGDA